MTLEHVLNRRFKQSTKWTPKGTNVSHSLWKHRLGNTKNVT